MDRDRKGDFPTGSSGGGGKRGYGVRNSFGYSEDDENPPANRQNTNRNERNRPHGAGRYFLDWMDDFRRRAENPQELQFCNVESDSSDDEFVCDVERFDNVRGAPQGDYGERHGAYGYTAYVGYYGYPNFGAGYSFPGVVAAPVYGHAGPVFGRFGGNNGVNYNRAGGDHFEPMPNNGGMYFRTRRHGCFGVCAFGCNPFLAINREYNGGILYYASLVAYAYQNRNGNIISEMLSLRDRHIFNIMEATNYADTIIEICNNSDLASALINHLEALKALLARNLPLALSKQIACVNAIMKLLNKPYTLNEDWTFPVIFTVTFDLRVITDRAASAGCRGRVVLRYDWPANTACEFHPGGCDCHQNKRR